MSQIDNENKGTVNQKFIILGHGGHGKDEVAKMLAEKYGIVYRGSSEFCAEHVVFPTMLDQYSDYMDCFNDRSNHRAHWHQTISAYNSPDKTRLATELLASGVDVYVGMRCKEEFKACVKEKLFDVVIWVDASKRVPLESSDSMSITLKDVERVFPVVHVIDNNGTKDDLIEKLDDMWVVMNNPQPVMRLTERRIIALQEMCDALESGECGDYTPEVNVIRAFLGSRSQDS